MKTTRLSSAEVAALLRSPDLAEPLSELTRLSVTLLRGGWSTLSDRVLDIRGAYRQRTIDHVVFAATNRRMVAEHLSVLAEGLVCGETHYEYGTCSKDAYDGHTWHRDGPGVEWQDIMHATPSLPVVHCGTCGEPEGSTYAKRCCTPDNMIED